MLHCLSYKVRINQIQNSIHAYYLPTHTAVYNIGLYVFRTVYTLCDTRTYVPPNFM